MSLDTSIHILVAALPTILALLGAFLTGHKVVGKRRMGQASAYAMLAAQSAEELFGPDSGAAKEQYAITQLKRQFHVSDEAAALLVNAAVAALRHAGIKLPKAPAQPPAENAAA